MKKIFKILCAFILLTISFGCFNAIDVKADQELEWTGYYELQYDLSTNSGGGFLKLENTTIPSGKMNKATVEDKDGNSYSLGKQFEVDRTNNTVYFYGLEEYKSQLVQGERYTLKLSGNNGVGFEVAFTFLSKAISTVEDVKALDIYSPDVHLDGYYVLLNDLVLEKGQENQHVGLNSAYAYTGFSGYFDGQGHSITFDATNGKGFFGKISSHKEDVEGNVVIHNQLRDTDNDGRTTLHVLRVRTPDGEIVDRDGNANDDEALCLDASKTKGPTIINVGFVDCKVMQTAIVANTTNLVYSGKALIKDIYLRTSKDSNSPQGTIFPGGSIWARIENVFIECPDQHVDYESITWGKSGALYGNDSNKEHSSRDEYHKNIYIVADMPVVYMRPGAALRPGQGNWFTVFGENEGKEVDWENGVYVFKNVYKYLTHTDLKQANHDYSDFNSEYWDTSLGIPVWKSAKNRMVDTFVETEAYFKNDTVTLYIEGINTAEFGFGFGNLSINSEEFNVEIVRGGEFIRLENNVITAYFTPEDTTSVAKINVRAVYNGLTYENEYTVLVIQRPLIPEEPEEPENPDNPENPENPENPNGSGNNNDQKGGCGSVAFDINNFSGGIGAMMLLSGAFVYIKRKLNKKSQGGRI